MGIGTSLGAYFEDSFQHQAGVEEVIKPKDTGDDNVLPPDDSQTKGSDKPTPVSDIKTASPLVTITDADIEKGINLGLSFSGGGLSIFGKGRPKPIPEEAAAASEGPSVFDQFMAGRGSRQPSNIIADAPPAPLEDIVSGGQVWRHNPETNVYEHQGLADPIYRGRPVDHPDFTRAVEEYHDLLVQHSNSHPNETWQPRGIRPGESLRDFATREVHQADPNLRDHGHPPEPLPEPEAQEPMNWRQHYDDVIAQQEAEHLASVSRIKESFKDNPNVIQNKDISLLKQPGGNKYYQQFHFMNKEGNLGEMSVQSRDEGKTLWVPWMGGVGGGPHSIGAAEVRAIIPVLKELYPNAERIGGFRVSGARAKARSTGDAYMRLRPSAQAAE